VVVSVKWRGRVPNGGGVVLGENSAHFLVSGPAFRGRSGVGLGKTLDAAPHLGLVRPER
jgi:hypothetical protein